MDESWVTMFNQGWVFSFKKPEIETRFPPLILLHGLSGDETSLRTLSSKLDRKRWVIALRGIQAAPDKGYAWVPAKSRSKSNFDPAVNAFLPELDSINSLLGIAAPMVDLMGFSQGAAFASLLLVSYPHLVRRTALLSGFLPDLEGEIHPDLSDHQVMISHGTEDNLVPFSEALRTADVMTSLGAEVSFCQSNTRHKIGAYCLSQLETFFD